MPIPSTRVVHPNRVGEIVGTTDQTMPALATVKRPTSTKSAGGGDTVTFTTVLRDRPCRMRALGKRVVAGEVADQSTEVSRWAVSFDPADDVRTFDRIEIASREFTVLDGGVESYPTELRCLCVEVAA